MNCCYIIHSETLKRHYIGACHDDLDDRITKHNSHEYGDHHYTAKVNDWRLVLKIECQTFSQAVRIESHIKKMKSSIYIQNLLKYSEMIVSLKEKYKSN